MKHVLILTIALAAAGWAQPRGGMMMRSPAFQALDADHDGVVSVGELANAAKALRSLDKNGDGKLTEDEVRPQMGQGRGGRGPGEGRGGPGESAGPSADDLVQTLMAFDKNGDGKLAKDEVPERMQGLFDRADSDHDGVLTADEIRKSAQSAAAPAGGGREGGFRGERGREGRGGERPSFMRMEPILAALDTDSDGEISAAELAAAPASLKKLDKDGDGQLSAEEVRINFDGRGRERV